MGFEANLAPLGFLGGPFSHICYNYLFLKDIFFIKPVWKTLKLLLPWLVAAALLYYLFRKIPPAQILKSLRHAQLVPLLIFAPLYFIAVALMDTWGLSRVLSKFAVPVTFRQLWPGRCVSYLLSIVNYNAGQAGLAFYVKKTRGASIFKVLGAIFFVTVTDLYWIITLAFFGSFFFDFSMGAFHSSQWIQWVALIAFAALFIHLAFWRRWFNWIIPFKVHFAFVDWIRGRHLFQAFHHATLGDYVRIALYRLPIFLLIIVSQWILIRIFGATISWTQIMAVIPMIFLLGSIPITPGGLGATQMATVELLKDKIQSPYFDQGLISPEDLLFSLSLSWLALNYFLKALFGLYYWIKNPHDLFRKDSTDITPSNAVHPSQD